MFRWSRTQIRWFGTATNGRATKTNGLDRCGRLGDRCEVWTLSVVPVGPSRSKTITKPRLCTTHSSSQCYTKQTRGARHGTVLPPGECNNIIAELMPTEHCQQFILMPCDAVYKRGYCRHAVCPSVRLSHSWVAPKRTECLLHAELNDVGLI